MARPSSRPVIAPVVAAGLGLTLGAAPAALAAQESGTSEAAAHSALVRGLLAEHPEPAAIRRLMDERSSGPMISDNPRTSGRKLAGGLGPRMTAAARQANDLKQAWAKAVRRTLKGEDIQVAGASLSPDISGFPSSSYVIENRQSQATSFWCGPATASEALGQITHYSGHNDNKTQSQLAAAGQLDTDKYGSTPWYNGGYIMPNTLNKDDDGYNDYVPVGLPSTPTNAQVSTYESDLVVDIYLHIPAIGDSWMVDGGPHLKGAASSQTYFHWFDIRGYTGEGANTAYEDSAFTEYATQSSRTVADILGGRGYDW
jgi:hypothetical protein